MARISYGSEVQKRSKRLLAALLVYANDELDGEDGVIDGLRLHIQVRWLGSTRLVVRTKVRFLQVLTGLVAGGEISVSSSNQLNSNQLNSEQLNPDQIKEALRRWHDFLGILEDNRPTKGGSETWHFTLNLWCDRYDISANLERFDHEWETRKTQGKVNSAFISSSHNSSNSPSDSPSVVTQSAVTQSVKQKLKQPKKTEFPFPTNFWQDICRQTLTTQNQHRLTTNPLTSGDGVSFEWEQVYIPLGLVERKQRERRTGNITAVQGSQLYEGDESEVTQTFTTTEFLETVLSSEHTKNLAIIGEPGAGKTTLLQKIAGWILNNTDSLVVWVSLADLQTQTLEEYLIDTWLRMATRKRQVPEEMELAFCDQFNQGKVWLLLDAVDEMAIASSQALSKIAFFLRGWVGDAKVVLTCRLNVWDAGKNALENFDTYRNLNFSYGNGDGSAEKTDQVSLFIQRWFAASPELAHKLRSELDKPGRRRIKDAVKNPLRLALLCRTWGLGQGELANTKFILYQQFAEAIYAWKQDRFPTSLSDRQQLNQALAKLALQAMFQEKSKFRLSHGFISQVLGDDIAMFELALQLGWLNHVGISPTPGERLYGFYHPTFQEYFAALAIADWRFFWDGHRVFNPEWREVILLWLGRDDISLEHKEELIQTLIEFKDRCGGLYQCQAYFIAAIAICELADCRFAPDIIAQLIKWRFGYYHPQQKRWWRYPAPISEGARIALLRSDRKLAIAALESFVQSSPSDFDIWNAAYSLGRTFDPGNAIAISALEKLITSRHRHEQLRLQAADSLGKIYPGNAIAITHLRDLINSAKKESLRRKAAFSLGKIDPGNQLAISTLELFLKTTTNQKLQQQIATNLQVIDPNNQIAEQIFMSLSSATIEKEANRSTKSNHPAREITALIEKILASPDEDAKRRRAARLAKADPGNEIAFSTLIYLVKSANSNIVRKRTADNFKKVLLDEQIPDVITALKTCFSNEITEIEQEQYRDCYKLLWHCAEKIPYSQFLQIWLVRE